MPTKLWDPPRELVENALMTKYMRSLDRGFESYEGVLPARSMRGARWFSGAQLNYAEHAFRGKPDDRVAIVHAGELRDQAEVTWGGLRGQVAAIAAGLRAPGV